MRAVLSGGREREPAPAGPGWRVGFLLSIVVVPMYLLYGRWAVDDAFIVLAYARHFLDHGQVALNLGEPINAITSPLWFAIALAESAAVRLVTPSIEAPVIGIRLLSGLSTVWSIVGFATLTYRLFEKRASRALALSLFLLNPWLWRWAFSGMEVGLSLALLTTAFLWAAGPGGDGKRWAALLLLGLGSLARPELLLLGFIFLAQYAWGEGGEAKKRRLAAALPAAFALPALWAIFASASMATVLPQSSLAKKAVLAPIEGTAYAAQVLVTSVPVFFLLVFVAGCSALGRYVRSSDRGGTLRRIFPPFAGLWTPHILWGLALPSFYVVGGYVPLTRYLILAAPSLVVGAVRLFEVVTARVDGEARLRPALAAALVGLTALSWGWVSYERVLPSSNGGRLATYKAFGNWLRRESEPNARVAWVEIGAISYYSDRYVVDLMGLVLSPPLFALLKKEGAEALLDSLRPEYLISTDSLPTERGLPVLRERSFSPLASAAAREETLTLYRMSRAEGSRRPRAVPHSETDPKPVQ